MFFIFHSLNCQMSAIGLDILYTSIYQYIPVFKKFCTFVSTSPVKLYILFIQMPIQFISIDNQLNVPIYRQIVNSICDNIDKGILKLGDPLPSINKIASTYSLARGSVLTAYNELKASGIIRSVPGKGYFIASLRGQCNLIYSCCLQPFHHTKKFCIVC